MGFFLPLGLTRIRDWNIPLLVGPLLHAIQADAALRMLDRNGVVLAMDDLDDLKEHALEQPHLVQHNTDGDRLELLASMFAVCPQAVARAL